ncbi:hypothetical protein HD806DRAFT_355319 [Xylariaceae sp. AK1471]|nr:hypothetical protein HD806DRAFT_355319 [Xylariaceae sp. AK1471]
MEVIGLVAAIPGLIEITQKTISVIRALIDQESFVRQVTELLDQLELIQEILQEILSRLKSSTIHHSHFNRLTTVTRSLKGELIALSDLFQPLTASPGRTAKVLNRARLLICGLEGKIKKYHERLDKAKSTLTLVIVARNEAIVEENLMISRTNLRLKLKEVLLPCEYSFIPHNLQGTCEWIWSHPIFCEWQKDPASSSPVGHEHRIMCIHGPKGCGKSVLAASIVKKLKSPDNHTFGFSFWAGSDDQRKTVAFLRTFLWHMIQKIPDDNLAQISAPLLESLPLTEKTVEDVILIVLKTIKSRVYCVIDGIDESIDDWAQPYAGGLRLVLDLIKTHANLRIVLLGRDASMRSAISLKPLSIEVTEELIRPDINRFILDLLDSSPKIQGAAMRQVVQETLQESSRVMFLWVKLIFGEINRCQLPCDVIPILHQVPRDLDREYHRLFVRLQDRLRGTRNTPSLSMKRAKCLLSWIIAAPEPLTYEELRCAFAISQCPDKGYEQYMLSEDSITDTCGDFIRVSDGRYHIAHTSIVEFLIRPIEIWQYEDETIDYFCIDVLQDQSFMCLECVNYFQRTDLGYPLVDPSAAMSHINLPIFSCALKFALIYLTRTHASKHRKTVWQHLEDFMRTPQFCSLAECGLLILQCESVTCSEQQAEIMKFIAWVGLNDSDELSMALSLFGTTFKEELARREKIFGRDSDPFRTWKYFVDILSGQITVSGLHDVEDNSSLKDREKGSGNHIDKSRQTINVQARRAAEHTAMLKIGDMVATQAPFSQTLTRLVPRFTSIIPELLPIHFLIFLALRETNRAREERYWSSALKRLEGANNFLEAYCAIGLGVCRYRDNKWDETAEDLLNRCRQIAMNLPPSLHVDVLLCSTLKYLARRHYDLNQFSKAQEIVSELQQRLSNGPTKGYVSTPLERKLYFPLFWDDWKAELLADIAKFHASQRTDDYTAKALSIVDSNIQLYKDPGHRRVRASIVAYRAKAEALYSQWHNNGGKIPCELAYNSEAACREALQLAKFPNSAKHVARQWWVGAILCRLLYRQRRYQEARELISQIPADFPPAAGMLSTISFAAIAANLGNLEAGEAILEQASSKIQGEQVSLLRSESKHIANLITALIKVRPIVRLWLLVSLCYLHRYRDLISTALHERDWWYKDARDPRIPSTPCFCEWWDILYIRYLALADYDDGHTRNARFLIRALRHEVRDYKYKEDASKYEDVTSESEEVSASEGAGSGYADFSFGCEEFAFEYARNQNYEAAAVVSRYLISYDLQRNSTDPFHWSLYYTALSLHFTFRGEEALLICRSMLFWTEKCVPYRHQCWCYLNIGIACFKIGYDHKRNRNPLSAEFFKPAVVSFTRARDIWAPNVNNESTSGVLADILRWRRASRSALEGLGIPMASLEPTASSQANLNMKDRDGILKHQSCPDLRARYVKEVQSHRTKYNLWRKQSTKPT